MSRTHHAGQSLAECDCGHTIRMKPERHRFHGGYVVCGACGDGMDVEA